MSALSKRARRVRTGNEFDMTALARALVAPAEGARVYSWSLEEIYAARDAQARGHFARAARLATAMRTDDAIAVARTNRLSPLRCIKVQLEPAKGARAKPIAREAEALYGQDGVGVSPATLGSIHGCLVDHGVAFAQNVWTVRDDGTRVDVEVRYWPIEHVRWEPTRRCFVTRADPSTWQPDQAPPDGNAFAEIPIVHGDGRWLIFSAFDHEPFNQEPAILSAALVWARHAFATRDWSKSSVAHGSAKVIGELPEGIALQNADGSLTAEAAAFVELIRAIASADAPVGIRPAGAKTDFLTNTSTAWQIFAELVNNAEKAAARIYLGTDGMLGAQGGAPGVDIAALFGVATTRVQSDVQVIQRGLGTGSIEIWTALNFDDSTLAPTRKYLMADPDEDAARASEARYMTAFFDEIDRAKASGFPITPEYVEHVAKKHGVEAPASLLSSTPDGRAAQMTAALLADIREAIDLGLRVDQPWINTMANLYRIPTIKLADVQSIQRPPQPRLALLPKPAGAPTKS